MAETLDLRGDGAPAAEVGWSAARRDPKFSGSGSRSGSAGELRHAVHDADRNPLGSRSVHGARRRDAGYRRVRRPGETCEVARSGSPEGGPDEA